MNANDIPQCVWKWINKKGAPLVLIMTPHPLGGMMYLEDDLELAEEMSKAYAEFMRKRLEQKTKRKKTLNKEKE